MNWFEADKEDNVKTTIWKFKIMPGKTVLDMPIGARILGVMVHGEEVFLWALVNSDAVKQPRTFYAAGTGHALPDRAFEWTHLGSIQLDKGNLIFHIFEDPRS